MNGLPLKHWIKPILFLLIAVLTVFALRQLPVNDWLKAFNDQVAEWGAWGVAAFIGVYALAAVALIPGSVLTLGAGFAFGIGPGMIAVSAASTLGAALAFLVSRYLARERVRKKFEHNAKVRAVDRAVAEQGWKIVALLRLSPAFPYTALNYILGLTGVKFGHYVLASWAGMLPGTLLYVYIGSIGKAAAEATAGGGEVDVLKYIFYGIGFLATLAVTVYITRLASKAIKETTPLEEPA